MLPVLLLLLLMLAPLPFEARPEQLDMAELNSYLARKLDIVSNLTGWRAQSIAATSILQSGAARIVYFGDFDSNEASSFQSSLTLLALLPRYAVASAVGSIGFVDTSNAAGERLQRQLGVRMKHSIVGWRGGVRQEFHGYRNVQLLLDFVDRLRTAEPQRIDGPDGKTVLMSLKEQRSREAVVLLLPDEADDRAVGGWRAELDSLSVQLPAYFGAGRRVAKAFGTVPGSVAYRSPVTGSFVLARLRDFNDRRLSDLLRHLRSAESVMPLSAANVYLPAAEADVWDEEAAASSGDGGGGLNRKLRAKPLLVLLVDPEAQAASSTAMSLMKRLLSVRRQEQQQQQQWWLAASLNPWQRVAGEPEVDWRGILGGVSLDRGPSFLLTINRRFGGSDILNPADVFHLDSWQVKEDDSAGFETVLTELLGWLRWRIRSLEEAAQRNDRLRTAGEL